jgi:hypothetical protein
VNLVLAQAFSIAPTESAAGNQIRFAESPMPDWRTPKNVTGVRGWKTPGFTFFAA